MVQDGVLSFSLDMHQAVSFNQICWREQISRKSGHLQWHNLCKYRTQGALDLDCMCCIKRSRTWYLDPTTKIFQTCFGIWLVWLWKRQAFIPSWVSSGHGKYFRPTNWVYFKSTQLRTNEVTIISALNETLLPPHGIVQDCYSWETL